MFNGVNVLMCIDDVTDSGFTNDYALTVRDKVVLHPEALQFILITLHSFGINLEKSTFSECYCSMTVLLQSNNIC